MQQTNKQNRLVKIIIGLELVCLLLLGAGYIFQTGQLTALSQAKKSQEMAINQIKAENLDLQTSYLAKLSLKNIDQKLAGLDFVPVGDIKYINLPTTILAARINN